MPCRDCLARSIPGRASVDGPPQSERVSQGAFGRRLWHSWARRLGQLVCVILLSNLMLNCQFKIPRNNQTTAFSTRWPDVLVMAIHWRVTKPATPAAQRMPQDPVFESVISNTSCVSRFLVI